MTAISLRGLSIAYGTHKVIKAVTADIPAGQITAVLGPSGCGKTTLLKSLNRLLDLNEDAKVEGEVLIDGTNIHGPDADVLALRKKVGFLSQKPSPLPMSIYDNVAFGPRIHGLQGRHVTLPLMELEKKDLISSDSSGDSGELSGRSSGIDSVVEYYLRLSGLWDDVKDRLHSPASQLSVGQQQRLALARALAVEPEMILADEPTSALDPASAQLIEKQLKILKKNYTVVIVTHILRQARRIADHILFLHMGELIEQGPAEQFFHSPKDERSRAYIRGEFS